MIRINEAAGTDKEDLYLEAVRKLFKLDQLGEEVNRETKNRHRYAQQ
ncbi:MAG: hypothetical protein K0Q75_1304 [Anaerospora sp.]|nr:hypothetical protein [Anaerospora sp.]